MKLRPSKKIQALIEQRITPITFINGKMNVVIIVIQSTKPNESSNSSRDNNNMDVELFSSRVNGIFSFLKTKSKNLRK